MDPSPRRLDAVVVTPDFDQLAVAEHPSSISASVGEPRLLLQQITKQWNKRRDPVLDHVDLALEQGQVVALWGENGAGKTTLLRITAGLIGADSGTVRLEDLRPQRVDRISLGQRQRVRLALTFLHDPQLVLLDEPRNSLDGSGVSLLTQALEEHRKAGGTAIWCAPTGEGVDMDFDAAYQLSGGKLERA